MTTSSAAIRTKFTLFYDSLVDVHPAQFAEGAPKRIGSTFRVPGAGGLDAQTFYMRHVLDLLFDDSQVVEDLIALCRCAYRGKEPPADAVTRIGATEGVHETLFLATEAASGLTARIGKWDAGTDLFANILTNTDCALQMAGLYDHAKMRGLQPSPVPANEGTMDQSTIDALFG